MPDITGLNSNVALYFPSEDQFVDMNELGAQEHKADYLPWKWQFGVTPTDRMCFWPMDTGPTAQFYRTDLFAAASLPRDPEEVAASTDTWPAWLDAGKKLKRNSGVSLIANASIVYSQIVNASAERYFSPAGRALFQDQEGTIRRAWDVAVAAARAGVTARVQTPAEMNSAWVSGKVASHIEAVWWGPILKSTAPDSSGTWAVAHQPGAPGNSGGSFLAIPKSCKDPKAAFDFITWLTSPAAQIQTYRDVQLFPSAPKAFESPQLSSPDKFFGGQDVLGVFQESAKEVPITFISPYDSQVSEGVLKELVNVETQGKDPDRAWADAMAQGIRQLEKRGLMT
ncbi:extracellular solute-binding protein [Lacisediminihabitans profunda]|uniref:extracellular solute-binding protein n=1 Tax=Lacisediminihabitans profunda TaxID=2594790 RepID=UPI00164FFA23|nr:extracellular solute-binding protein [Lacisediminihabitans profunda]